MLSKSNNMNDLNIFNNIINIDNNSYVSNNSYSLISNFNSTILNENKIEERRISNNYLYPTLLSDESNEEITIQLDKPTGETSNEEKSIIGEQPEIDKEKSKNLFIVNNHPSQDNKSESKIHGKKNLGRKRKNDSTKGRHNKYSSDNIVRKCKHLVLNSLMEFINKKIKNMYNDKIGNNIFKKQLLTLNKEQKSDAKIQSNKQFLNKPIGDIFSVNISKRYTNYIPQHNKILIEGLKKEENENKKEYFNKLFNLTFLECLNHFMEIKKNELLEGMKCFHQIEKKLKDENDYIGILDFYLENYEKITMRKKSRKPRENKKEK